MLTLKMLTLLRRCELYDDLSGDELRLLATHSIVQAYNGGEIVLAAGETSESVFLVASGLLKLTVPFPTGRERTIALLGSGKAFGQMESLDGRAYRYCVQATRKSKLICTSGWAVSALLRRNPDFARRQLFCLGRQFESLVEHIECTASPAPLERIVRFLLNRVEQAAEGPVLVHLRGRKNLLASRLGMPAASLSRAFAELRDRGLLSVDGLTVAIYDVTALRRLLRHPVSGVDEHEPQVHGTLHLASRCLPAPATTRSPHSR